MCDVGECYVMLWMKNMMCVGVSVGVGVSEGV